MCSAENVITHFAFPAATAAATLSDSPACAIGGASWLADHSYQGCLAARYASYSPTVHVLRLWVVCKNLKAAFPNFM